MLPVVPEDTDETVPADAAVEDDPVFDDVTAAFAALYTDEEVELVGDARPGSSAEALAEPEEDAPEEDAPPEAPRSVVVVEAIEVAPEDGTPEDGTPEDDHPAPLEPEDAAPTPIAAAAPDLVPGAEDAPFEPDADDDEPEEVPPPRQTSPQRPSFLREEVPVDVIVPEPSFPKPVPPAPPRPALVMAPRSLDLPRPAADDAPSDDGPAPGRLPELAPPAAAAPVSAAPLANEQPLWSGVKGVTNSSSRETELGDGKWNEPARSPEEIRQAFPSTPTRNLQISDGASNLPLYAAAALALLSLTIFWLYQNNQQPAETFTLPEPTTEVVESTPAAAMIEVQVLAGSQGEVIFEGVSYGMTPAGIPLPEDSGSRSLCLQFNDRSRCHQVTRAQLAANQVFLFDTATASTP